MNVLTVKTLELVSQDIQRDIHFTLRMEHHTDYVFKDEEASQYSATISMADTTTVISKIIECSSDIGEFTIVLEDLNLEASKIDRYTIQGGKMIDKKEWNWEWEG